MEKLTNEQVCIAIQHLDGFELNDIWFMYLSSKDKVYMPSYVTGSQIKNWPSELLHIIPNDVPRKCTITSSFVRIEFNYDEQVDEGGAFSTFFREEYKNPPGELRLVKLRNGPLHEKAPQICPYCGLLSLDESCTHSLVVSGSAGQLCRDIGKLNTWQSIVERQNYFDAFNKDFKGIKYTYQPSTLGKELFRSCWIYAESREAAIGYFDELVYSIGIASSRAKNFSS